MKSKIIYKKIIIFILLLVQFSAFDFKKLQAERIAFTSLNFFSLTEEDGLPQNSVLSICKDSYGFMWFGTYSGLCRYDGSRYINFTPQQSNENGYSAIVMAVVELANKDICFLSADGYLYVYKRDAEIVQQLKLPSEIQGTVTDITSDSDNSIWVATSNGIYKLDDNVMSFKKYGIDTSALSALFIDEKNHIWAGGDNFVYNVNLDSLSVHSKITLVNTHSIKKNNIVSCITSDKNNNVWVALNGNGVVKIDSSGSVVKHYTVASGLTSNNAKALFVDSLDLWIGTKESGIDILNLKSQNVYNEHSDYLNENSLSVSSINELYFDGHNTLWIGTEYGGVNVFDYNNQHFRFVNFDANPSSLLPFYIPHAMYEDKKGDVLIGGKWTVGIYNRQVNDTRYIDLSAFTNEGTGNVISIAEDLYNNYWFVCEGAGVIRYNKITRKTEQYANYWENGTVKGDAFVNAVFVDSRGTVWIGSRNNGLLRYDFARKQFFHKGLLENEADTCSINIINEDDNGNLWIGTANHGLIELNTSNDSVSIYKNNKNQDNSLSNNYVTDISFDMYGHVWVATKYNGVNQLNYQNKTFRRITRNEGLSSNRTYCVVYSDSVGMWVTSENGLNFISQDDLSVTSYFTKDGLKTNHFLPQSAFGLSTGEVLLGVQGGIHVFDGKIDIKTAFSDNVIISDIYLSGNKISVKDGNAQGILIDKPVYLLDTLIIEHSDVSIAFGFASFSYSEAVTYTYEYQLEGVNVLWQKTEENKTANYMGLPAGEYSLSVRVLKEGEVTGAQKNLIIIVKSPFWKETWFLISVFLFVVVMAVVVFQIREYRAAKRTAKLKKVVEERTSQLNLQNKVLEQNANELRHYNEVLNDRSTEIEEKATELLSHREKLLFQREKLLEMNTKLEESNRTKDKLFSIISHDLRSPFTSILGFSELLAQNCEKWEIERVKKFAVGLNDSSQKVYSLLDNLLNWAKLQQEGITFKAKDFDLNDVVRQNLALFKETAWNKRIDLVNLSDSKLMVYADKSMITTIIRNLLNNAIKFTNEEGAVYITCIKDLNGVTITVVDNGVGIDETVQDKILGDEEYSTVGTKHEKGTGLGLVLCKDFIERHNGSIWFTSEKGKGSVFYVFIPEKNIVSKVT